MSAKRMGQNVNSRGPLWLPERDKNGNVLVRRFARAAIQTWSRIRDYAAREHIDLAQAEEMVENIVRNMSLARRRGMKANVRKPESFIYACFTRQVKRLSARERKFKYFGSTAELELFPKAQDWEWRLRLDNALQGKEVIAYMDATTRRTYWKRSQGYSWKEIAKRQGVRVNTAIKTYERGLQRTRERMQVRNDTDTIS